MEDSLAQVERDDRRTARHWETAGLRVEQANEALGDCLVIREAGHLLLERPEIHSGIVADDVLPREEHNGEAGVEHLVVATREDGAAGHFDHCSVERGERARDAVVGQVVGGLWELGTHEDGRISTTKQRGLHRHPLAQGRNVKVERAVAGVQPLLAGTVANFGDGWLGADVRRAGFCDVACVGLEEDPRVVLVGVERQFAGLEVLVSRASALNRGPF